MPGRVGYAFGPYQLHTSPKRLVRDDADVTLPPRHLDLLLVLVSRAGELVTKDVLLAEAWGDVAVSDNSLNQAISRLRAALDEAHPTRYIETAARRGYRFAAAVQPIAATQAEVDVEAMLTPYRALMDGRAAIETLERAQIDRARATFEHLIREHHHKAGVHIGLANACVLQFEATRADRTPDTEALRLAVTHARDACRLGPDQGEAWATLGFVLARIGDQADALAAHRHSVELEPDNWRHRLRHAYGSWAEERLRAARKALDLCPDSPLARVLAATVYVARDALSLAKTELEISRASVPTTTGGPARFPVVALHWLTGLIGLVRDTEADALEALHAEVALEGRGHLYARECSASAWYAIGAIHLRRGDRTGARAAFGESLARVPQHPMARAGLALVDGQAFELPPDAEPSVDLAMARAAWLVAHDEQAAAANLVTAALAAAPPGNAGWLLPVDPLIGVQRSRELWRPALALLRARAE